MGMSSGESSETDFLHIALGNPLRRDDGVARRVLDSLKPAKSLKQVQATPELATDIKGFKRVVFIDAAVDGELRLEPIAESPPSSLTHTANAAEVIALARALYGFTGAAWQCRIPGEDFAIGEGLSERAASNAALAVRLLENWELEGA